MNKKRFFILLVFGLLITQSAFFRYRNTDFSGNTRIPTLYSYAFPLNFSVYLPKNIESGKLYPVLYLLHGQSQDEKIWQRLGIVEKMEALIDSGLIKPFIIVLPREEKYLEAIDESEYKMLITDELMPFVESHFPVSTNRAATGIGGISRGALWAEILGFNDYERFGVLGLHSLPGSFVSDYKIFTTLRDNRGILSPIKIHVDIGFNDPYLAGTERFIEQLEIAGLSSWFYRYSGGHDEAYWGKTLSDNLLWYGTMLYTPDDLYQREF